MNRGIFNFLVKMNREILNINIKRRECIRTKLALEQMCIEIVYLDRNLI